MKKILCLFLLSACLLLCSCGNFIKMKMNYDLLIKDAEYVEIIFENVATKEVRVLKKLDNETALEFLKEYSQIEYSCSISGALFTPPPTRYYGLSFRVKKSDPQLEYDYCTIRSGAFSCNSVEYYDLICKYCPDIDLEEYLPEEYNQQ